MKPQWPSLLACLACPSLSVENRSRWQRSHLKLEDQAGSSQTPDCFCLRGWNIGDDSGESETCQSGARHVCKCVRFGSVAEQTADEMSSVGEGPGWRPKVQQPGQGPNKALQDSAGMKIKSCDLKF